jgi:radical SAM superfamily enzyme YgiQ (UPF0313 family)
MKNSSVQLIQMIEDNKGPYYFAERTAPPLGLLSIATYLSETILDMKVEILDNAILSTEDIRRNINADLVGFSVNLWNYSKSLEMAKIAKEKGAITIMGGHHASSVAKNILKNRDYIDYIIIGDGEKAFTDLAGGNDILDIENLVYRSKYSNKIVTNKKK